VKRPKASILLFALLVMASAAACGGRAEERTVPNVTGLQLDGAQARLDARRLDHTVAGGGVFGVILRSRWQVCDQDPRPGTKAAEVVLVVERACSRVPPVRSTVVPNVEYDPLDEAEAELVQAGLGFEVVRDGVIVVRSNWTVCDQEPAPGEWGATVELYVERDCWDW